MIGSASSSNTTSGVAGRRSACTRKSPSASIAMAAAARSGSNSCAAAANSASSALATRAARVGWTSMARSRHNSAATVKRASRPHGSSEPSVSRRAAYNQCGQSAASSTASSHSGRGIAGQRARPRAASAATGNSRPNSGVGVVRPMRALSSVGTVALLATATCPPEQSTGRQRHRRELGLGRARNLADGELRNAGRQRQRLVDRALLAAGVAHDAIDRDERRVVGQQRIAQPERGDLPGRAAVVDQFLVVAERGDSAAGPQRRECRLLGRRRLRCTSMVR